MSIYRANNRLQHLPLAVLLALICLFFACGTTGVTPNQTTAAGAHLVDLSWKPSSTPSVIKYNVYRSSQPTGPFNLVESAPGAVYTDSSVKSGQTYYYAVTSVDSNGTESGFSNVAAATIPTP